MFINKFGRSDLYAGTAQIYFLIHLSYLVHFTNLRETAACGVEMVTT